MLRWIPALTLLLFLGPIAAGLVGTFLPAFGILPALGGTEFSLAPWRRLFAEPGLETSLRLTLTTGFAAAAVSLAMVLAFLAACHGSRPVAVVRRLLAPLLAVPHVAVAIGFAFLAAPSGWAARIVSPWLSGWERPPDLATAPDPYGVALVCGLVLKEVPFLLLMTLAALGQVPADRTLAVARSLGYGPATAWFKTVLPLVWPQIRLPFYAVVAYSLSVVDMALVLAPGTPPPLAPRVLRWFSDPDLDRQFVAAAGAGLQFLLVIAALGTIRAGERLTGLLGRWWIAAGGRGRGGRGGRIAATGALGLVFGLGLLGILGMALWSVARRWRWPELLPSDWTIGNWTRQGAALAWPGWITVSVAATAALVAIVLVVGCLENEQRYRVTPGSRVLWLIYAPLLAPQIAFLFGVQVLLVAAGLDGSWAALVWGHLLFVLPYVFLALAGPWRRLDERYGRTALCLGASPARVLWRVKLPMLLRPVLFAFAVGFAVSVGEYLPTVFAGGGRFATLTTEAVSLAAGGDRRVIGVYAFLQALLPWLGFTLALLIPAWLYRERRGMKAFTA
ncbi:MAG: ABC transporter permease subunit [Rhodospirillales bacterium]|nr:MAG: ABC transporter permease subunit [Rhodospirillales bacterium]